MPFVVVYDACVLHDPAVRDVLVTLATKRALNLRAKWSTEILAEMVRTILRRRPDLDATRLERTVELMIDAVPDCMVTGWEPLVPALTLPDPGDRHVLAAAIRAQAQVIVTSNHADFPPETLDPYGIETQGPDDFVAGLIDLHPESVVAAITEIVLRLRHPPQSMDETLMLLSGRGLPRSALLLADLTM